VARFKAGNRDGKTKIVKLTNNTKENLNIKTNGKEEEMITTIKESLKTKNKKISTQEKLNMVKKSSHHNILVKLLTKMKAINIRESHNNCKNKKTTSIKENHRIKNRTINTKGNPNINNNNQMITPTNQVSNQVLDHRLDQVHLPLSNTLEILQVENHKLLSDTPSEIL